MKRLQFVPTPIAEKIARNRNRDRSPNKETKPQSWGVRVLQAAGLYLLCSFLVVFLTTGILLSISELPHLQSAYILLFVALFTAILWRYARKLYLIPALSFSLLLSTQLNFTAGILTATLGLLIVTAKLPIWQSVPLLAAITQTAISLLLRNQPSNALSITLAFTLTLHLILKFLAQYAKNLTAYLEKQFERLPQYFQHAGLIVTITAFLLPLIYIITLKP